MSRLSIICAVMLAATGIYGSMARGSQQAAKEVPKTTQPAKESGEDPVVAKLLDQTITEKQVQATINQMASQQQLSPQQLQQKDTILFKDALNTLIDMALLRNEGKVQKITVEPGKVDGTFQNLAARFPSAEQFKAAMEKQGLTEAALRKSIEENLLFQQVVEQALKNLPGPTEEDIKKFYDDNPQYFEEPETVHAAHILLKVDKNATPEQKAEIKKKIEGILNDIESKQITFAEAAAKNSEDTSNAQKGGDLGFFARGQMVKPFEDAAFSAKAGTVTPAVETQFGFHLINVIEIKPAGKKSLEDAKPVIQQFLEQKSKQEGTRKYLEGLRTKAQVETVMSEEEWGKRHQPK
jgi:peptidyl-prolyl cis-trans isomerase C